MNPILRARIENGRSMLAHPKQLSLSVPVVALIALLLGGGCNATSGQDDRSEDDSSPNELESAEYSLREAAEISLEVEYARARIELLCMESKGFQAHYLSPQRPDAEAVESFIRISLIPDRPWFLEIPESFVEHQPTDGYPEGVNGEDEEIDQPGMTDEYWSEYDAAYIGAADFEAAREDPDIWPVAGGCKGEVQDRLFTEIGLGRTDVLVPSQLSSDEVERRFREDSEWIELSRNWSSCIEDAGFPHFEDPGQAVTYVAYARSGDGHGYFDLEGPRPEGAPWSTQRVDEFGGELALAMQSCDAEVGFSERAYKVWAHRSEGLMSELETEFWAWQENLRRALEQAGIILQNGW